MTLLSSHPLPDDRPLRVGYVVKRYPRFSETFIVNEILTHEAAGHELEVFALYPPNDAHFQDTLGRVRAPVTYLTSEGFRGGDFWTVFEQAGRVLPGFWTELGSCSGACAREVYQAAWLARLVRERGLGHLHAHFASTATTVARLAARFVGVPYTFTAHAKDIFHQSVNATDLRQKLTDAAAVVTVSDFNLAHLRRGFGVAAHHLQRIYNGLDLERFRFQSPLQREARIVAVGRLIEKKGFEVLLEACADLRSRGVAHVCEIIGTGELESALRAQTAQLQLDESVRFLGARPQGEVVERVQSAAVLAAPSVVGGDGNVDGLPTVLLEAMALGTPCVATDVTGIPEVVRHDETGLMVPQRDAAALANALERLLRDGGLRARLATKARRLVEDEFDVRRNAAVLFDIFSIAARRAILPDGAPNLQAPSARAGLRVL